MIATRDDDIFKLIKIAEDNKGTKKSLADNLHGGIESETWNAKKERARREKIKNDNLESDQIMKKRSLVGLFIFLGIETVVFFIIIFLQGFENNFHLEEWNFRIFIGATLGQITAMLHTAIKHLFPERK